MFIFKKLKEKMQVFHAPDAGTLVNATGNYVNAYEGTTETFSAPNDLSSTMKTYYDTELLENARPNFVHAQFAKKQALPKNHGKTVEWRKWNTLEDAKQLTEGVIPQGQKLGQSSMTSAITQYGTYVAVTDLLELHAIDDTILGATEELGASAGTTQDKLVRDTLAAGTNVQYAGGATSRKTLTAENVITPTEINKAVTTLKKMKAPPINGKYVAIIHPSVTFDLRENKDWIEAHKYAATQELFEGEIGELHGVRFIETSEAKVFKDETTTPTGLAVYSTLVLGKDAFTTVDPEGGALEMIVKTKDTVGGPLNQFSTIGYKFETATKILYQDRMVRIESTSAYSATDEAN